MKKFVFCQNTELWECKIHFSKKEILIGFQTHVFKMEEREYG